MPVLRSLHVALNVTDLDRADRFYGELLGLPRADRPLSFPGLWYQVGEFQIHLIQSAAVAPSGEAEKWGRNPHLALAVDDLAGVKARLQAAGCPLQPSASGRPALFVRDPDGNIVELGQVPAAPAADR